MMTYLSNKQKGSDFERQFCEELKNRGFWVHFMNPNSSGAQPTDVIAVKNGVAYLIDCKTSIVNVFTINRLQDNQKLALWRWKNCGNTNGYIAVLFNERIYMISYDLLKQKERIVLTDEFLLEKQIDNN